MKISILAFSVFLGFMSCKSKESEMSGTPEKDPAQLPSTTTERPAQPVFKNVEPDSKTPVCYAGNGGSFQFTSLQGTVQGTLVLNGDGLKLNGAKFLGISKNDTLKGICLGAGAPLELWFQKSGETYTLLNGEKSKDEKGAMTFVDAKKIKPTNIVMTKGTCK